MAKNRNITTTQLALMTAAAVISLRGLPMMAQEELTMFFYIFFATFLFLIPAALVGAELGSAFASKGGGVYTWVKEAFNKHMGFTAIFLQWIQNVVWYPTVLGFAAASIAYMIGNILNLRKRHLTRCHYSCCAKLFHHFCAIAVTDGHLGACVNIHFGKILTDKLKSPHILHDHGI